MIYGRDQYNIVKQLSSNKKGNKQTNRNFWAPPEFLILACDGELMWRWGLGRREYAKGL